METHPLKQSTVILTLLLLLSVASFAHQDDDDNPPRQIIPNSGQRLTPTAPLGSRFEPLNPALPQHPDYLAGQAVTTITSPDHKTLLILTSGYNVLNYSTGPNAGNADPAASNQYVFIYDISNKIPIKKQVVQVPNTYNGIAFDPSHPTFYVSGGVDDSVHIFDLAPADHLWHERSGSPISLGHPNGVGLQVKPQAAGIAVTADGSHLVIADYYNDALTILANTNGTWAKSAELDLRPGKIDPAKFSGVPGGEYPFWVSIKTNNTAYVSSLRDREIDVVSLGGTPSLTARIKVKGQPNKMILNTAQTKLFVAEDETDTVDIIDTAANRVTATIDAGAPPGLLPAGFQGHNTNSVALSPDEKTLYVTNGTTNDVAVISLAAHSVIGLIPTGWYPTSVSTTADGKYLYVTNYKSLTGPNRQFCNSGCYGSNQYGEQLIKAGFQSFPAPTETQLLRLTSIVAANNHFGRGLSQTDRAKIAFLHSKIKHVIFIIKENRTYDQVLGDLPLGNGDPEITEFGQAVTPNLHALATSFVTLDNFYDRSEVSMDGWPWTVSARAPDVVERQVPVNYAERGLTNDSEGTNRNINVALPTLAERLAANPLSPDDPDVLPGTANTAAPDNRLHEQNRGYIWNDALRAGLSLRNYGFFIDLARYNLPSAQAQFNIPELEMPFETKTQVSYATDEALRPLTDIYFRGFDNSFPDYWRYREWEREFDANYAKTGLPNLELVRFMHDHTGDFQTAIDGINTVDLQEADNDYAVGLLAEKIANSVYKNNTLIFTIEDDSQAGADHVDSHRSIAFVAGPYVKQHALVSRAYNTVDFLRTIEEILGLKPTNLSDALAVPMLDVFEERLHDWTFKAVPSALLANTKLPIPSAAFAGLKPMQPTRDAAYWAAASKGMDFTAEDRIDFAKYNHILWQGMMGDKAYPEKPTGLNLRKNRGQLRPDK